MTEAITIPELAARLSEAAPARRLVVALAGPPGAGKSHAAAELEAALTARGRRAAILPMDGFHYDDAVLLARGLLPRKGAPETFDVAGFAHMLMRLAANEEPEIAVPVFDRALEISRAGARLIPREVDMLIVEGNYLLLDRPPWSGLAPRFDVTVQVTAAEPDLQRRLTERWESAGLDPAEVRRKVEANDLVNCRLVLEASLPAGFVIET